MFNAGKILISSKNHSVCFIQKKEKEGGFLYQAMPHFTGKKTTD